MTESAPVDRIAQVLTNASYRRLPPPLTIANVAFDLPAAFVGTGIVPDLVVVLDTIKEEAARIRQKVEGISRALDVVRSRRPLTAILAGPRPTPHVLDALSKVCRVLPVGTVLTAEPEGALRDWLSVLLPL